MTFLSIEKEKKEKLKEFICKTIPNINLNSDALNLIGEQFEIFDLSKHEFLLKEGKISGYYFLMQGFLRSFTYDNDGNEITTNFYSGERIIFEPASFFQHIPSFENIQAITDCVGLISTFNKLNILFHTVPEFREFARAIIVKEFVALKQDNVSKINKSAESRYFDLIKNNKELFQVAQLKHIASYLDMTDTSLSRIRKQITKR